MLSKTKLSMNENGELETSLERIEMMDERIIIVPFDQLINLKVGEIQGIKEIVICDAITAKKPEFIGFRKYPELSLFFVFEKNDQIGVKSYITPSIEMDNYGLQDLYMFLIQRFFESEKKVTIKTPAIKTFKEIKKAYKKNGKKSGLNESINEFIVINYNTKGKTFKQLMTEYHKILIDADKTVRSNIFK